MGDVYIVVLETHNLGIQIDVFANESLAIEKAKQQAGEFADYYSEQVIEDSLEGCVYYAYWGHEGDNITVKKTAVKNG